MFLLKDKTETYKCLVNFWSMVQTQFGVQIQRVRSGNGTKFTNGPLKTFFSEKRVILETSCVDTPQHNGYME